MTFNLEGHHLGQLNSSLGTRLESDINLSRCARGDISRRCSRGGAAAAGNDLGDLDWLVKNVGDLDLAGLGYFSGHLAKVQDLWLKLDGLTRVNWRSGLHWSDSDWSLVRCRILGWRLPALHLWIKVVNPVGRWHRRVTLRLGSGGTTVAGRRGCWRL